jgi:hypothetical protein
MNILDENVLESQRQRLTVWHIPFRQIGYEVERKGMADDEIIPLLLTIRQPTFFTLDADFFKRSLCDARYGLVHLDVDESEAAAFIRRLLNHSEFNTHAKRMGVVVRVSHARIDVWRLGVMQEQRFAWEE